MSDYILVGMVVMDKIEEAEKRHKIMVDFLYHLFEEENVPEWKVYLDNFINTNYEK